jgi:hypothetical protein
MNIIRTSKYVSHNDLLVTDDNRARQYIYQEYKGECKIKFIDI